MPSHLKTTRGGQRPTHQTGGVRYGFGAGRESGTYPRRTLNTPVGLGSETLGDKLQMSKGKQPRSSDKAPKCPLSEKEVGPQGQPGGSLRSSNPLKSA